MESIKLTLADVLTKGRAAFIAGKLSCQDPDVNMRACEYRTGNNRPCIVGAALTDEEVGKMAVDGYTGPVSDLAFTDEDQPAVLDIPEDEVVAMQELQNLHDNACLRAAFANGLSPYQSYLDLAAALDVPPELIPVRAPLPGLEEEAPPMT